MFLLVLVQLNLVLFICYSLNLYSYAVLGVIQVVLKYSHLQENVNNYNLQCRMLLKLHHVLYALKLLELLHYVDDNVKYPT